jgi:hypothetical protein
MTRFTIYTYLFKPINEPQQLYYDCETIKDALKSLFK